jgi:hypothetical protein
MQNQEYHYTYKDRNPLSWLAMAVGIGLLLFGYSYAAPWYFMAPAAVSLVMLTIIISRNGTYGCSISDGKFSYFMGIKKSHIPLKDIETMMAKHRMDGGTDITIILKNGQKIAISSFCICSDIVPEMRKTGISVSVN